MPVQLPAGMTSLPPLGGGLLSAYRCLWWILLVLALVTALSAWINPGLPPLGIMLLRQAKSAVLIAVSAMLYRRRQRDPVAAMLALAFLLWTVSSSIDFASTNSWTVLVDRVRFLFFAWALLLFPDGSLKAAWIRPMAAAIFLTFLLGVAETIGLLPTALFLPLAIGCVVATLFALGIRYRSNGEGVERQQLKWVTLGLFGGIVLILSARAGNALAAGMAMPLIGFVALEAMFQLGIVVLALGFLISLLRYRLYDAEAAISRSAIYATLTLALVGIFAACEALIELLGQRYLGSNIGSISGAVAAAIAAVLLTPLHGRFASWAEQFFQHDLAALKRDLPELLATLAGSSSVKHLARAVLPRIEQAVQSTRVALIIDGRPVAAQGIALARAVSLLRGWIPSDASGPIARNDDEAFPLGVALRCPFGGIRGWLLLGPRPDGSYYGKDDVNALATIASPFQRTLFLVVERETEARRNSAMRAAISRALASLGKRLAILEKEIRLN